MVLLQQGKGGDMANAFGGGGSQAAFGARAGATVLTKATSILGVLFMIGAIALGRDWQARRGVADGRLQGPGDEYAGSGSAAGPEATAPAADAAATAVTRAGPGRQHAGEGAGGTRSKLAESPSRKWRNWQTHQLEGLALARAWGFESPLSHQLSNRQVTVLVTVGLGLPSATYESISDDNS